ncbi:MAG: glucose-6-phosphate isomerase [Frankiales bacterium]|nr:glucose-6-phosphate isomerase [Frankiales bacterium]
MTSAGGTGLAGTQTGPLRLQFAYPEAESYAGAVEKLVADRVASRIAGQDPTLWGPDAEPESAIRLSWVSLADSSRPLVPEIEGLRAELLGEGVDRVVLAGMGGSSLAPEVICATAGVDLVTLDTTDAGQVRLALAGDLSRTVVVVSSKSGGTVETDSHRRVFEKAFTDQGIDAAQRIVIVTDPGSPLAKASAEAGYRKVFLADPHVGGRYSALTAFGLVPAGLAGVDLGALLDDAGSVTAALGSDDVQNAGLRLGALLGLAHNAGSDKVVFADLGTSIRGFGDWAEQLIAESTGKDGRGLLPVVVESADAPGFADAKQDAILVQLTADGAADAGYAPASGWGVAVGGPLGAQILMWEYATAVAGRLIGINPFDQPNVEEAKKQARALLDASGDAPADPAVLTDGLIAARVAGFDAGSPGSLADLLTAFLAQLPELGYVSVQAYLNRLVDTEATALRAAIARRTGCQTTFGWGPRFLHSTGQYHKGGHPNGVFLQITADVTEDLTIPDRPYTFAVLQAAQAKGDAAVLADHGRPVLRLHLSERAAGLSQLLQAL